MVKNTRLLRFKFSLREASPLPPTHTTSSPTLRPPLARPATAHGAARQAGSQAARRFPQAAPPPAAACCRGCIMSGDITRSVEQPDPSLCSVSSHCRPCWQSYGITTTRPTSRLRHRHSGLVSQSAACAAMNREERLHSFWLMSKIYLNNDANNIFI